MRVMYDWRAGGWTGTAGDLRLAQERAEARLPPGGTAVVERVLVSCGHSSGLGASWTGARGQGGMVMWARDR